MSLYDWLYYESLLYKQEKKIPLTEDDLDYLDRLEFEADVEEDLRENYSGGNN